MDPGQHVPAESVLVVVDGRTIGQAKVGERRQDVARRVDQKLRHAGWHFAFRAFRVGPGSHIVEAYGVLPGQRAVRLGGSRSVEANKLSQSPVVSRTRAMA
jgi:hypothetical protein